MKLGLNNYLVYMTGLAGKGNGQRNALNTAKVLNQISPHFVENSFFINIDSLTLFPDTELYRMAQQGEFIPAGEKEGLEELLTLLKNLRLRTRIQADTLLNGLGSKYHDKITVDTFLSGEGFIESVKANAIYDIIYLDIELGMINGIDIGRLVRQQSTEALIVFVSSYDKYYKPAFDVQPFGFMDKPINKGEFETLFNRMYARIILNDNLFQYSINKVDKRVVYKEIMYFESVKRQLVMYTLTGQDMFYGSISKLADELKRKEFILTHQSFLVTYLHIAEFDYKQVKLANGKVIIIPINRRSVVRAEYMEIKRRGFGNDA